MFRKVVWEIVWLTEAREHGGLWCQQGICRL